MNIKEDDMVLERLREEFKRPKISEIKVRMPATEKDKLMKRARRLNKTLSGFCSEVLFMIANLSDEGMLDFIGLIKNETVKLSRQQVPINRVPAKKSSRKKAQR